MIKQIMTHKRVRFNLYIRTSSHVTVVKKRTAQLSCTTTLARIKELIRIIEAAIENEIDLNPEAIEVNGEIVGGVE